MLEIKIRGTLSSLTKCGAGCDSKDNVGAGTNQTVSVNTPRGVLGGSVAAIGGDYTVVPGSNTATPLGLFVNDFAGAAFDNSPAVASGKIAVIKLSSVEVNVYETQTAADAAVDLVYHAGDKLYASANGFLTKEVSTEGTVIGVVTKVPTTTSPFMGVDMRI